MGSGPVVIGYDGSDAAERALLDAAALLAPRPALVVVVWEPGAAFEALELPAASIGISPVPLDIRTALDTDAAQYRQAQEAAQRGAALAREGGLEAEGLVVADEVTIAETLVRVARERDAQALVVGPHGHGPMSEMLLGSTSRAVIRRASCPVLVSPAQRSDEAARASA
jgi:nucleotide-binding universal stress UspA family protein